MGNTTSSNPHSLTTQDLQKHASLGIENNLLAEAHVHRVSASEGRTKYRINAAGIAYPYFSLEELAKPSASRVHCYARIRRDAGDPKYLAPKGTDNRHLYLPPLPPDLITDPLTPLIFVEAEKSVLAITAWSRRIGREIVPIGTGGCWSWSRKVNGVDGELPEVALASEARRTYVMFDSNAVCNEMVDKARNEFVERLKRQGADVQIVDLPALPGVNGPDDFLSLYSDKDFRRVLDGELTLERIQVLEGMKIINDTLLKWFDDGCPEVPPLPLDIDKDMPASVLDGFLGELVTKYLSPQFPIAYAWPTLVTLAGLYLNDDQLNLYSGLIGEANSGKSDVYDWATQLLKLKGDARVLQGRFGSAEGFAKHFGDAQGRPRLYWPDELSYVMDKARIEGASWADTLTTMFYNRIMDMTIAGKQLIKIHMRLSLLGGIVEERFDDVFMNKTSNGLYDRFLFGRCPTDYQCLHRPFTGEPVVVDDGVSDYGSLGLQFDSPDLPRRLTSVKIAPDVWELRDEWVNKHSIRPRVAEICLRVARICAGWDGRSLLEAKDLQPTLELCKYQMAVRQKFSPNTGVNTGGIITQAVIKYAKQHGSNGEWMEERKMARSTHVYEQGADAVERVLNAMVASKLIERKPESSGGRPKKFFRLLARPDEI